MKMLAGRRAQLPDLADKRRFSLSWFTPAEPECRKKRMVLATCSGAAGASKSKRQEGGYGSGNRTMTADSRIHTGCDADSHIFLKIDNIS